MHQQSTTVSGDARNRAMAASLVIALLMLAGKLTAYFITNSDAIFSDALESVVHLVATGFAAFSLWYAVRPPDATHPYGHGKIAYLSAGFEGGLIMLAAVLIIYTSVRSLIVGPTLAQLGTGVVIEAVLMTINLGLGAYLVSTGKKHNSIVLVSNGQHVLSDMWTTLGVLVGLLIVYLTGIEWLDPVVAILVAFHILWIAGRLIARSFGGLMDRVDARDTEAIIARLDDAVREGKISGYHQLRHRRVNDRVLVEYHLMFSPGVSLGTAHTRSHDVEDSIIELFPKDAVVVTAHLEPDEHDHPDGYDEPGDPLTQPSEHLDHRE